MGKRYLYLDTFASVRVASDTALASSARAYIVDEKFTLVHSTMNLIEISSWQKRWPEVVSFVSFVPFCIAQNTDKITAREVASYPDELTSLPVEFCSSDYSFSADELKEAILFHLKGKIAGFARDYRNSNGETLQAILNKKESFLPEKSGRYSYVQRQMFMQSSVLSMLFPDYQDFLNRALAAAIEEGRKDGINIERFKSVYIQALAIFVEYYVQKKAGKLSDMGDILQLSLVPYVDLAVLDNERSNLIQRFNREGLFPSHLRACSLSDFMAMITR
jgi:hypothetical protein